MAYQPGSSALRATPAEIARRTGIDPALATSREARASVPAPQSPPALHGAVKVSGFPVKSKYPFAQIAADGGVWKLDAAVFKAKPGSIRSSANTYASINQMSVKTVIDGGFIYIQFTKGNA